MGFKMRIKSFNSGSKWHYKACDSKCHSGAQGSKCEYLVGSIQTLNMSSAPLSLLLMGSSRQRIESRVRFVFKLRTWGAQHNVIRERDLIGLIGSNL
jgi:hypothetical protein